MQSHESNPSTKTLGFFVLACLITWVLAVPTALAWVRHEAPPGYAMACAGLSAFGPLIAAMIVAGRQGKLRSVFGPWKTNPMWILAALLAPILARVLAVVFYRVAGGEPSQWFYPPSTPVQVTALIVFPLSEEFGWRGFAYPRLAARYGVVAGSLLLGAAWGLWHLGYSVSPHGNFDWFLFILGMIELPLYSVILAWFLERSGRSMAVAIAFHAAAHINHIEIAPHSELGLHVAHVVLVALLAFFAARSLTMRERRTASALGSVA